ncbi:hypothetical protein WEI85_23330 [Actinomycetes bacterium KLBMP 9797]
MFTARKRIAALAGAVLAGAATILSGAAPARAAPPGGTLPPGSVVCTTRVAATQGVAFYGSLQAPVTGVTALWTVYASTTGTGPETALLRLPSREPTTTYVSWPGTFFYRLCVTNTTAVNGGLRFNFFAPGSAPTASAGPVTAMLGPTGRYCYLATSVPARLAGTSTVPVRWTVDVENGDADFLRTEDFGTSATIDRLLNPGADEFHQVCVANTGSSTASVSYALTT